MFEKEMEEHCNKVICSLCEITCHAKCHDWQDEYDTFKDGAEFGYNKANEWHKVADCDLPKVDNRIVLCVCHNGYIDGKRNYILKLLTRKEFSLFIVYYWKEIVLPKELENV